MLNEVIFDVETKKIFNDIGDKDPSKLGVSIVSIYIRSLNEKFDEVKGEMKSFWEDDFYDMWKIFQEANRIIGYNSLKFDVPALKPYAPFDFAKLPHFDIMDEIKKITDHRISLDALAKETLGKYKIDSGINAIFYWEKGNKESLDKLKKYCEEDVLLTKEIYDYALKNKRLLFKDHWNNPRNIEVDFSYPEKVQSPAKQNSLF